jgi:sulfate permease, SulP family
MRSCEFALALVTGATVVIFGVEQGILLAVILSLLQHVRRTYRPPTGVIVREANGRWRLEEDSLTGKMPEPGLMIYWFGADLFYANVAFFMEQVRTLVEQSSPPLRWLVIDASAITGLDFTAGRAVADLQQDLAKTGVVLALIVVMVRRRGDLERMGLINRIGANRIFDSREACVNAYRLESSSGINTVGG